MAKDKHYLSQGGIRSFRNAVFEAVPEPSMQQTRIVLPPQKEQDTMRHEFNDLRNQQFVACVTGPALTEFYRSGPKTSAALPIWSAESDLGHVQETATFSVTALAIAVKKVVVLSTNKAADLIDATDMVKTPLRCDTAAVKRRLQLHCAVRNAGEHP